MNFVTLLCNVCCYFIGLCYDVLKSFEFCEPGEFLQIIVNLQVESHSVGT
jgi:hypothetical protein